MSKIVRLLIAGLVLMFVSGCGGGSTPSGDKFEIFKTYAKNGGISATPSVQDYMDAGIKGVTSANLAEVNKVVAGQNPEGVDTKEELKGLVRDLGHGPQDPVVRKLKKTGQKTSYDPDGKPDDTIKDDGFYESGVGPSYSRDSNNIVTDNVTGLMWQDNASAKTEKKPWTTQASYCENLTLGGYSDWKIPTGDELESIVDYGKPDYPVIDTSYFKNVGLDGKRTYWTRTSTPGSGGISIWTVRFNGGFYTLANKRHDSHYVRCVRNSSAYPDRFSRNDTANIVTDKQTKLMWQDNETPNKRWKEAIDYCESLVLGGYSDWRLPNIRELKSIASKSEVSRGIYDIFKKVKLHSNYWSATTMADTLDYARSVFFGSGDDALSYKQAAPEDYVRCVRDK